MNDTYVNNVMSLLRSAQEKNQIYAGEINLRHSATSEGWLLVFATIGAKPVILRVKGDAYDFAVCDRSEGDVRNITFTTTFVVDATSYFALGGSDGSISVYMCNTTRSHGTPPSLVLAAKYTASKKGKKCIFKDRNDPITYLESISLACLNRSDSSLVYLLASTKTQVSLVAFRATKEPTKEVKEIQAYLHITVDTVGSLLKCESCYSVFGPDSVAVLHFLSAQGSAVRICAVDLRHVLLLAEITRKHGKPISKLTLPPFLELPLQGLDATSVTSCVDKLSIRVASATDSLLNLQGTQETRAMSPFSFEAYFRLADGAEERRRLTLMQQRVSDAFALHSHQALQNPQSIMLSFEPEENETIVDVPDTQLTLEQALKSLGYLTCAKNESPQLTDMIECAIKLGHSAIVREYIIAKNTHNYNVHTFVLQEVKLLYNWTVSTFKAHIEKQITQLCTEKVVHVLLGKRPLVVPSQHQKEVFSTDVPIELLAELQNLIRLTNGLLCVCEGLCDRKTDQVFNAVEKMESNYMRQDFPKNLDELSHHKQEVSCLVQILSNLEFLLITPGLSFYPLLSGEYKKFMHQKTQQFNAAFHSRLLPAEILGCDNNYQYPPGTPTSLFGELVDRLHPEQRVSAQLAGVADIQTNSAIAERIVEFLFLPLRNLHAVANAAAGAGGASGGCTLSETVDAADAASATVHHTILDLYYLSANQSLEENTGSAGKGGSAVEQQSVPVSNYKRLSNSMQVIFHLPRSLAAALFYIWKVDTNIGPDSTAHEVCCADELLGDQRMLEAVVRRMLLTHSSMACRSLLKQLRRNPYLLSEFGALCTASALPAEDSWVHCWHEARQRCDDLPSAHAALIARGKVAGTLVRWAVRSDQLSTFLEAAMAPVEADAVYSFLQTLVQDECNRLNGEHRWLDVVVVWLLHRGHVDKAQSIHSAFSQRYIGAGKLMPANCLCTTLLDAYEPVRSA